MTDHIDPVILHAQVQHHDPDLFAGMPWDIASNQPVYRDDPSLLNERFAMPAECVRAVIVCPVPIVTQHGGIHMGTGVMVVDHDFRHLLVQVVDADCMAPINLN